MKPTLRDALEHRYAAWGVRPETLALIAKAINGTLSADGEIEVAPAATQAAVRSPAVTGGVAVISMRGLITPRPTFLSLLFGGGAGLEGFRSSLREAVASDDITAIVLDFDSPGGSTDLVPETAAEIRAARTTKPVIAVANTWAASAAYWLASQADELVVTPSGEVGSIGVFTLHEDISKLDENLGIKTTLISAGKYKTEGNPYEPLSEQAREALQTKVDEYYDMFVADVAKGRRATPAAVRGGYGEGRMVTAKQALDTGLADRIDTLEATVARTVRNPRRARRASADDPAVRLAAGEVVDDATATDVRTAAALIQMSEGNPEPNPPEGGEEAKARPSQAYIDAMYAPTR